MNTNTLLPAQLHDECKKHWRSLGIRSTDNLKANVQGIFENADSQKDALESLYRLALPSWERIAKIHGYPSVGVELWQFIARLFMDFDKVNYPNLMPGGAWMNTGFSVNREIEPWGIGFSDCTAELEPEPVRQRSA